MPTHISNKIEHLGSADAARHEEEKTSCHCDDAALQGPWTSPVETKVSSVSKSGTESVFALCPGMLLVERPDVSSISDVIVLKQDLCASCVHAQIEHITRKNPKAIMPSLRKEGLLNNSVSVGYGMPPRQLATVRLLSGVTLVNAPMLAPRFKKSIGSHRLPLGEVH